MYLFYLYYITYCYFNFEIIKYTDIDGSPLRSTRLTLRFLGWLGRCRSGCFACITSRGWKHCSSSSLPPRRSASLAMAFSSRTARTKKLWPMIWTITSTGCLLCCWPMPWLVAPGWPVRPIKRKSWTWGQIPPSSWTCCWIWSTSITSEPSVASQRCPWPNACSGSKHATWMSHWQRHLSAVDGDASPWIGCWILAMIWPMSEDSNRSVNWSLSLRPLTAPPREDGRPAPAPLRSEVYPDGLPTLSGRDA